MYEPTTAGQRWLAGIGYSLLVFGGAGAVAPDPTGVLALPVLLVGVAVLYHGFRRERYEALGWAVAAFAGFGAALAAVTGAASLPGTGFGRPAPALTALAGVALLGGGYLVALARS